ncbi:MAG: Hint domain-containing protein [Oligoflexales bacterium]
MKKIIFKVLLFLQSFYCYGHIERCNTDIIADESKMRGRNAWARKCGYVTKELENAANIASHYWSFASIKAPFSESTPCQSGLATAGMCPKGCFTGSQKIRFGGFYTPMKQAVDRGLQAYTSLSQGSLLEQEVELLDFVVGDTKEDILIIETKTGRKLEVTMGHPMVLENGDVVPAKTLTVGKSLLDEDLLGDKIESLETFSFTGKVYNIMSNSSIKEENLVFSEGLITGSIRFQNEWADEQFKLLTRTVLNVDLLD